MGKQGRLSERMSVVARDLQERQDDAEATFQHLVDLARANVSGCDSAALSFVDARRRIEIVAAAGDLALAGDRLQHELGEGPSRDSIWEQQTVHSANVGEDPRWPTWGPRAAEEAGARSLLALRLYTHGDTLGALNLYSRDPDAFDDDAREEGLAVASHGAIAIAAARQIAHLHTAVDSRTVIGQATGIVMERFGVDAATAFKVLTRLSSTENVKLRRIAAEVVDGRTVGQGG